VASSVLNQDIAGRQRHLRAIVELECHIAGEKDPEIRRVGPVKAGVSSTGFVAILEVHLWSGFWCNEVSRQVRPDDEADATYGRKNTGRRRIVPRVRVGCGLIGIPEEGELSQARMGVPSTFSSRTKTARPLASWPVTTMRTFIPCLFSSGLFMVTFLDSCNSVFIFNFPFVLLKSFSVNA
jgi:hypothetical protein